MKRLVNDAKCDLAPNVNENKKKKMMLFSGIRNLRIPIATRLTAGSLSIIILSSIIFTIVGVQIISNLTITEAEEKVRNDLNSARLIYNNQIDDILQAVRFTASRTFIQNILCCQASSDEVSQLIWFKETENLDVLTITDSNGTVVLRTNNPSARGDSQKDQSIVASVLRTQSAAIGTVIVPEEELKIESGYLASNAFFEFVDTPMARPRSENEQTSGMMLMAAYPIFNSAGNLIGVVYGGDLLNRDYTIVDEIKRTVFQGIVYEGKDIGTATIFQDDVRISTNVLNVDGSRALGTRISELVYEQVVEQGNIYVGRAYVVNDWYVAAYGPINDPEGNTIGILYVGILEQKYSDIKNRAIVIFLGIALGVALLSTIITLLISRRISRSIASLAAASGQLAKGNLDAKAEKTSNDEIGELSDSFNLMASALKDRDQQIKEFARKKIMESERLAMLGQLSANVAHDLNNPLQGIVTYSYLLLEEDSINNEGKENLRKIVAQATRCRDIIRGLLDFSRQKKPDKILCNVNDLLQSCLALVEKQARFFNIKVIVHLDKHLPMVVLDPSQVERVFLNLIINAADAMDGYGQLTLSTHHNQETNSVEIKFKDAGHGISEDNLEKIFEPFFTTKETGHGVGLGLAISYGIVKEHNGTISVESVVGKGTTFIVSFPLT